MSSHIVEERIRIVCVYLDALKHVALLLDECVPVPGFKEPQQFAAWVTGMADAAALQVRAIKAALPAECTDREAPLPHEGRRTVSHG